MIIPMRDSNRSHSQCSVLSRLFVAFIASTLIVGSVSPAVLQAAELEASGPVTKVRDGDTIVVGDIPVRFNGVSAPELDEAYGRESRQAMIDLVSGQHVRCELTGERSYDRWIGTCFLPDGTALPPENWIVLS